MPPLKPPPPKTSPKPAPQSVDAPMILTDDVEPSPPFIALNAMSHFGKTTAAAFAPDPLIIMAPREFGYLTLRGQRRVPRIDHVKVDTWPQMKALLGDLRDDASKYKTIAVDATSGFDEMCQEWTCDNYFGGKWGKKEGEFNNFGAGASRSKQEWTSVLKILDDIRWKFGITILLLSHVKIKTIKNPMGLDYDRFVPDFNDKAWGATQRIADTILFGTFDTVVDIDATSQKGHGKGIGGTDRIIYTEQRDAYDAKNRYGMPNSFLLPNDHTKTWETINKAMTGELNNAN